MKTMSCPKCGSNESDVKDTRPIDSGNQIRRRRQCRACGERFTTRETTVREPSLEQQKTNALLRQALTDLMKSIPEPVTERGKK